MGLQRQALAKKHILPKWGQWSLADVAMHPGAVADWHRDVTEANGPVSRIMLQRASRRTREAPSAT